MYPPDPASRDYCTLGGNINTNAGGPRAVKYGVTQRYVWGLTLVLMDGEVLQTGKRSIKGVAGYDVTALVCGSEGTLGIVTEAIMHLVPAPPAVQGRCPRPGARPAGPGRKSRVPSGCGRRSCAPRRAATRVCRVFFASRVARGLLKDRRRQARTTPAKGAEGCRSRGRAWWWTGTRPPRRWHTG